jgi:hypothetical protein
LNLSGEQRDSRKQHCHCADPIHFQVAEEQENTTMPETDKPDFTVVDHRQSAAAEETPSETVTAPVTATTDTTADAEVLEQPFPTQSASSADAESTSSEDPYGMPDPAMLIAFAAMQTTPQELLGLLAPAFDSQARRALGLIADSQTGELSQDMDTAKTAIDAVQFCLSKSESALEAAEYREMMRRLNDLRLTYVAKLQNS